MLVYPTIVDVGLLVGLLGQTEFYQFVEETRVEGHR